MNPSRFQLPQYVSEDRRRGRAHTLELERRRFELKRDDLGGEREAGDFRRLPPTCAKIPGEMDFPASMISALGVDRVKSMLVYGSARISNVIHPLTSERGYRSLFRLMGESMATIAGWREDVAFGRQRMTGVNPMILRQLRDDAKTPLWEAGAEVMDKKQPSGRPKMTMGDAFRLGRLFVADYSVLWDPRIQKHVASDAHLGAPTCLFWSDDYGDLLPLAIQLKPAWMREKNPVFTPLHPYADWMAARAHVGSADTHVHEAPYHLLETHLVSEAVALSLYREVHPDHPLRQLLDPHYEYNLAINKLALGDLLAKGGTIDTTVAAGVAGALNAARMHYAKWSFKDRWLKKDLHDRGVHDPATLPQYYYRDDAVLVHDAVTRYTAAILSLWYRTDEDVLEDEELQGFVRACGSEDGGDIPGFPTAVTTRQDLFELVAELIFRAGPQHAAVNNGQFDAYGFIPGTPGRLTLPLADAPPGDGGGITEAQLWEAMPSLHVSLSQMGMVWVLSRPTIRTLLHSGQSPAFHPSLCYEADEIVSAFRRRLGAISEGIQRRNAPLQVGYRYLDPLNISRSTDI